MKLSATASRVWGRAGEPNSCVPWWLRIRCSTRTARAAGNPGIALILSRHHPCANHDVAEQAAFGGIFDAARITQFFDFSDVVKDDAREKQIGVELRVMLGNGSREAREADDMLEQATDERMMHGHGGGSALQLRNDRGILDELIEQLLQIRIFHLRDGGAQL